MDRTITTVDPDQDGAFTIRFAECNHETTGVPSPVACGLGQGDHVPCRECTREARKLLGTIDTAIRQSEALLWPNHPVALQLEKAWRAMLKIITPAIGE
jgi:hypothetical protein